LDRNFQGLRNQVDAVLASIQRSCQSTQDAIDYACTIADILKKWQPEQTASSKQSTQAEGETEDTNLESQAQVEDKVVMEKYRQTPSQPTKQALTRLAKAIPNLKAKVKTRNRSLANSKTAYEISSHVTHLNCPSLLVNCWQTDWKEDVHQEGSQQ
ncbi:MAG: hypothetical protein IJU76_13205, partial [Desulfovibrionaceae bacterium]|nr:hypothetical protein [Desulfovibrionaceae bacterium]